jgi:hypothetical protein
VSCYLLNHNALALRRSINSITINLHAAMQSVSVLLLQSDESDDAIGIVGTRLVSLQSLSQASKYYGYKSVVYTSGFVINLTEESQDLEISTQSAQL